MRSPSFDQQSLSSPASARRAGLALLAAALVLAGPAARCARASGDDPLPTPTAGKHAEPSAESLVNDGLAQAKRGEWKAAEARYRAAIATSRTIPEAWNGLGHALKNQRRFDEAIAAYDEALKLRPAYPQALEYLGETYVMMGRYGSARKVLARLRPLDRQLAAQLQSSIDNRTLRASNW
ncbi:MAG TPA: tetratricopeptide repeat protein [Candidatus Binatia bacterium]|nr:tetratricopeptide repeat protein [Candidatus Binatia bacterium]